MTLSPLTRRRLANFRANRRGYWSLVIFGFLFFVTLFAEFIANDRPLVAKVDGRWFVPVLVMTRLFLRGGTVQCPSNRRGSWDR